MAPYPFHLRPPSKFEAELLFELEGTRVAAGVLGLEHEFEVALAYEQERQLSRPERALRPSEVLQVLNRANNKRVK